MRGTFGIGPVHLGAVAILGGALAGCSVHPLPQDVTRVSTVQIVSRIRCEAKEGLEAVLAKAAAHSSARKKHVDMIVDGTTIGLEFDFKISETNGIGLNKLELERESAKTGENFNLTLVGGIDSGVEDDPAVRKNTRVFRVVDNLNELRTARCRRSGQAGPNLLYPITGSTGMADVVRTYLELEVLTDLSNGKDNPKLVTFTDDIEFTTTIGTDATVDLEIKTAGATLRLTKVVGAAGVASRKDVHAVKVVLSRDADRQVDLPRYIEAVRDRDLQTSLAQMRALSRNKVLIEFSKSRKAAEDRAVAERVLGQRVP
jgi:hypothetical protein